MRPAYTVSLVASCLAALLSLGAACGGEPPPAPESNEPDGPADGDALVTVDGLTVTFGEVAPYLEYLDALRPLVSRKQKIKAVLDRHVLPLVLARRAFPERREALLDQAASLAEVASTVHDLEQRGEPFGGRRTEGLARKLELPVEAFLFDPALTGKTSPPLEVPQGYLVVAAYELLPGAINVDDLVHAYQVPFYTHAMPQFRAWFAGEQARVAEKVTYVHPDYLEALPHWLKAP